MKILMAAVLFCLSLAVYVWNATAPIFDCQDSVLQEVGSADGKHLATVFARDCGATTSKSTIVSLRVTGSKFRPKTEDILLVLVSSDPISIEWIENDAVRVVFKNAEVFRQQNQWRDIKVLFADQTKPTEDP